MIVTSLPRSGSTRWCEQRAEELGLPLVDELFEMGMSSRVKQQIHTIKTLAPHQKTAETIADMNFDQMIINNHEITWFNLEKTDVFLSRRNAQDTVWSYIAFRDKLHLEVENREQTVADELMRTHLRRFKLRMMFFYDYVRVKNRSLTMVDLTWTDQTLYRQQYAKWQQMVDWIGQGVTLPNGVVWS